MKYRRTKGFTIVELLVVIVVVAILAAITVVAYTGIQKRAYNSARASDITQIDKLLKMYNASFGAYPAMSTVAGTIYCPGTGYANGRCHYSTNESDKTVSNELLKVTNSIPSPSVRQVRVGWDVGPYIVVVDQNSFNMYGVFDGKNTCPANTQTDYYDIPTGKQHCMISYTR